MKLKIIYSLFRCFSRWSHQCFSEVWDRQRARVVFTVVMTQARQSGARGDGAGCSCSLIIIKRQTSLALRILIYCDVWPLRLATRTEQPPHPRLPSPYTGAWHLFFNVWSVTPVWLFSFCNLKLTSPVATQSMAMSPHNETRVLSNRHSNMYQRVCEWSCFISFFGVCRATL